MKIAIIQNNPHLGNYDFNCEQLNLEFKKFPDALCLTSAYAFIGNPWQGLSKIGGFAQRLGLAKNKLFHDSSILIQTLENCSDLENKPVWLLKNQTNDNKIEQDVIRVNDICFYAPFDCKADKLEQLKIPYEAKMVYLACSDQFYDGLDLENVLIKMAKKWQLPIVYVNNCGACDGIIYAGHSMLIAKNGQVLAKLAPFSEDDFCFDFDGENISCTPKITRFEKEQYLFEATVLSIRDYAKKCNIKQAVLGISGGMDSAFVATLACEALGSENVTGIMMPSKFSSDHSLADAKQLIKNLNMASHIIPITEIVDGFEKNLSPCLNSLPSLKNPELDLTLDNLQARVRGNLLMAYANRTSAMVLGTGNKSETAMGYCTLYGDTVGALEPIGDIYKTRVYDIANWYNEFKKQEIIPENIFTKAPSAELRPGQKDEDSLPPYPLLDDFLYQLLEENKDIEQISVSKLDNEDKNNILNRLKFSEFKRKQSPFIVSLSVCSFGQNYNLPVCAKGF